MKKINVLYLSVNPSYYDIEKLTKATFEEAKNFAENDTINALTCNEITIDMEKAAEYSFCPQGAEFGDNGDALLMWIKVCGE